MLRDLQILCEQYDFSGATDDINEVNFFSGLEPDLLDTIDLSDYIESRSSIVFKKSREEIDKFQDSLKLYGTFDTLKLELSNLIQPKLFDFFALDNNDTNSFLTYKVFIYKGDNLIAQGIIRANDFVYNQPLEPNDRDIIQCTIYEWAKEFKDYHSQGTMPDLSTPHNYWINQTFNGSTVEYITLTSLVEGLFGIGDMEMMTDQGIDGNTSLRKWRMVRIPNLINPQTDVNNGDYPTYWQMNGYDYIRDNQNLSPFEFFKKLCNSMGWVFYFKIINNELKFIIRNRKTKSTFYNRRTIDNKDIIGYDTQYKTYRQKVKSIKIPAFEISGGKRILLGPLDLFDDDINEKIKGAYDLVFSKEVTAPLADHIFCNEMKINFSSSSNKILPKPYSDYGFSKYASSNGDNTVYVNQYYDYSQNPVRFIQNFVNLESKFLLEIDGGHNNFTADKKRRKDLNNGTATDYASGDNISDRDLIYTGNIGTAMIRRDADDVYAQYVALNNTVAGNRDYSKSDQMKANIEALLTDNSNLVLPITVIGFYLELDEVIDFTNPNIEFPFGYEYDIASLEADYINEQTTFYLQRRYIE